MEYVVCTLSELSISQISLVYCYGCAGMRMELQAIASRIDSLEIGIFKVYCIIDPL